MSYTTINEIQNRLKNVIYSLNEYTRGSYENDPRAKELVERFKMALNPNIMKNPNIQEEIVNTLLNLLMIASELGVDLESKTIELIERMEEPLYASA
ncbi:MAG: hypothetical protein ACXADA_17655 [Candidatus Hodarchaeales archaeon]